MADIALIVTSAIFAILVFIGSIYFLVYFQHPEDKWVAWFPKFIVVVGLSVACYNVLLLPLDVANQNGRYIATGGLPMDTLNLIFYITTVCLCLLIVPFTVFYYEGADGKDGDSSIGSQIFNALKWMIPLLVVLLIITLPLYFTSGFADIQTIYLNNTFELGGAYTDIFCNSTSSSLCTSQQLTDSVRVSFTVYIVAITSFIGWILFVMFGGVGLFALPVDIFTDFKYRPKPLKKSEYLEKKLVIGEVATALMKSAQEIQNESKNLGAAKNSRFNRRARTYRLRETEFRRDVYLLEETYKKIEEAYRMNGGNPIVMFGKLIVGVIGIIISILWILHILLFLIPTYLNLVPVSNFLSDIFTSTATIPLLGPLFFGIFAFWLLVCVVKGAVKLGMRILFVTIHPMKFGETFMSSLVFNVGLILFCSLSVVQFCVIAFPTYVRYTSVTTLFATQIQNLRYLKYGYIAFIYAFLIVNFLTWLFLGFKPHDNKTAKKLTI